MVLITETFPLSGFLNIPQLITGEKTQKHKDSKVVKISFPSASIMSFIVRNEYHCSVRQEHMMCNDVITFSCLRILRLTLCKPRVRILYSENCHCCYLETLLCLQCLDHGEW